MAFQINHFCGATSKVCRAPWLVGFFLFLIIAFNCFLMWPKCFICTFCAYFLPLHHFQVISGYSLHYSSTCPLAYTDFHLTYDLHLPHSLSLAIPASPWGDLGPTRTLVRVSSATRSPPTAVSVENALGIQFLLMIEWYCAPFATVLCWPIASE